MKKILLFLLILVVNFGIAYTITSLFGIRNIILFQSMSAINNTITYEIIIWLILCLIEYGIYKYLLYRKLQNDKIVKELNEALKEMKERLKNNN